MKSLGFLELVFDTGHSVTPLMGHRGCLASHWSVPVLHSFFPFTVFLWNVLPDAVIESDTPAQFKTAEAETAADVIQLRRSQ